MKYKIFTKAFVKIKTSGQDILKTRTGVAKLHSCCRATSKPCQKNPAHYKHDNNLVTKPNIAAARKAH